MAIDYGEYKIKQDYIDAVVELISRVEGHEPKAADKDDGEITIGYGYTFGNRSNNVELWTAAGITLTQAEREVLQRIDSAATKVEKNSIALSEFRREISKDEAIELLKQTYPEYEGPANTLNMPLSPERVAFVAVTYNRGPGNVKKHMADFYKAIRDGNRAEAWFQIRYNALGNKAPDTVDGIAKARYLQSQVFGLYDDPADIKAAEAASVFKMFQRHRKEIYDHEESFGQKFDGTNGTRNMISMGNRDSEYRLALEFFGLSRIGIETINQALDHGKTALLADLRTQHPEIADKLTDAIVSTSIYLNPAKETDANRSSTMDARPYETGLYKKNGADDLMIGMDQTDIMYGGKGNDILIGGDGKDTLVGGAGEDTLVGGNGVDTYIVEGNDHIVDSDGQGILKDKNGQVIVGAFTKQADGRFIWVGSPDIIATKNSPLTLYMPDGSKVVIQDHNDGDFGIRLLDTPNALPTNNTIVGDQDPNNLNDILYDSFLNDRIEGGVGNDTIMAYGGGADWILGGDGRDAISALTGDDTAEGNAGADIVFGGIGDDQLFGGNYGKLEDLMAQGETAPNIAARGDLVSGNTWDDFIYGSNAKDALFGGDGNDTLVGGGGDDAIFGDYDAEEATTDWTFTNTSSYPNASFLLTNVNVGSGDFKGNDVIYAGTGNDYVMAGGGDDLVDAGVGNDREIIMRRAA